MWDKILFWGGLLLTLTVLAKSIYHKEKTLTNGTEILLKLVPKDPRSMMQGDYMALRYNLELQLSRQPNRPRQGTIEVKVGTDQVAYLPTTKTKDTSLLLQYKKRNGKIQIGPNAFFIQEGDTKLYENARYAVLKVDENGHAVLIALADKNRKTITFAPRKKAN